MNTRQSRLQRELITLQQMLGIYCRGRHGTQHGLCAECEELRNYAAQRLDRCPFGEKKGTCAHCPIHCYKAEMRENIRRMMRYAGPRMLYRYPLSALRHLFDGFRRFPESR